MAAAAQEKKGFNVAILDVGEHCSYAGALVLVSGSSDRQTSAVADAVVERMRERHHLRPLAREGSGGWVLVDYGDVILHVFLEETRAFYDLERLWSQAPRIPVPAAAPQTEDAPRPTALSRMR